MVAWANGGYGDRVRLLMICMETGDDGIATAQSFGKRFQIPSTVLNGYIEAPSEAPTYGQLGCGGFIVLGRYGEFASARTVPAFLDKGMLAFAAVERLLSELGVPRQTASAPAAAEETPVPAAALRLSQVRVASAARGRRPDCRRSEEERREMREPDAAQRMERAREQ